MILDEIADFTKRRVDISKSKKSVEEIKKEAYSLNTDTGYPFEQALKKEGISFICEVKKASPSKGVIAPKFPYIDIAKEYEAAGASAISCLTEPKFFQGNDLYLKEIRQAVSIPVLRKDFTVDEYMIYEAKNLGADAILLICAILSDEQLKEYFQIADELGLTSLVETHDENELKRALNIGARVIGVNNRNLKDFTVDINNSIRLRQMAPKDKIFVSESGIKVPDDIRNLVANKTDAVLIGETFMRSRDKKRMLDWLRGDVDSL